jgi:hypothetical protein
MDNVITINHKRTATPSDIVSPAPVQGGAVLPHASLLPFEQRMELLKSLAGKAGLRLPSTRLPEGHALWDIGEKNKRKLQSEIDALPSFPDAAQAMLTRIELEDPQDFKRQDIRGFVMNPLNGRIHGNEDSADEAIGYTVPGFEQWVSFLKPPSLYGSPAQFMLTMSPAVRAQVFNEMTGNAVMDKTITLRTIVEPSTLTPLGHGVFTGGVRTIRAVTSNKHSLETGDDSAIIQTILLNEYDAVKHAKARLTREHHRSEFELVWPGMKRQLVVGDVALIVVSISNSEVKAGSLKVEVKLLRVLCANFTTAYSSDDEAEVVSIRHVGDLRTKLVEAVGKALKRADPFVKLFGDAYNNPFPLNLSRGEVIDRARKALELTEDFSKQLVGAWDMDGVKSAGNTLAGLVNAMTRVSQDMEMEKAAEVERAAGKLIAEGWAGIGVGA